VAYFRESQTAEASKPLCFVISPIGSDGSEIRKTSDKVLKHVITKPLENKYRIERADEISKPGLITMQIIQRLQDADLVIADLSDGNPNVYYELAIRHYLAKPIVHIIAAGQEAPFDVNQMRYVPFTITDPDSIDAAQKQLLAHVEALEKGEKIVTPIQLAHILAEPALDGKGNETLDVLNALYGAVSNLQQEMRSTKEFVQEMYFESPARTIGMFGMNTAGVSGMKLSSLSGAPFSTTPVRTVGFGSLADRVAAKQAVKSAKGEPPAESTPTKPEDLPPKEK